MNKVLLMIAMLLNYSGAQARSCRDEPERCPVLRLSCIERYTESNRSSYTYLAASLYDSLFSGTSVRVSESQCVRTNILSCTGTELKGRWDIYKSTNQYFLVNLSNRKTYPLDCSVKNEDIP